MKIKMFPQVRDRNRIWYEIEDQKITATIKGKTDTFDFTDMPNGELELYDSEGNWLVETELDEVPIVSAKKENGELTVEILFTIDMNEKDDKLLFPEPMTLDEFNSLMNELSARKESKSENANPMPEETIPLQDEPEPQPVESEPEEDEHVEFTEVGGMDDLLKYLEKTGTTSIQLERQMEELEREGYFIDPDIESIAEE